MPSLLKTLLLLATKTWEQFGADNCTQMAAAIAYYVLFAIVPLTIFLVSVATVAVPDDTRADATDWVEDYLNVTPDDVTITLNSNAMAGIEERFGVNALDKIGRELVDINESEDRAGERKRLAETIDAGEAIPVAGYDLAADEVKVRSASFISEIMEQAKDAAVPLGIVGFVALAFSASIAFSAIRRSLNLVWDAPHRPFFQQRVMELSMLLGLVILLGASVAATATVQVLRELSEGPQNPTTSGSGILWLAFGYLLPWAFTFVLVLLSYRYVPNTANSIHDVWLGAALASAAIEVLKYGYGVYVVNFSNYGPAYGALAGVLLFMFFVWLSSYIFLLGAELAVEYPRVMRGDYVKVDSEGTQLHGLRQTALGAVKGLFVATRKGAKKSEPPRGHSPSQRDTH